MKKYNSYQDSGIEWLGDTPTHWSNNRIDWITAFVRGNTGLKKDELLEIGDYVALQYGKTYKVDEVDNSFNFFVNSEYYKRNQTVQRGDTILISTSETIEDLGHSCYYNREEIGLLGGEQILLKPKTKLINEKYLYYFSKIFCDELRKYATGLKVFRFNTDDLKKVFITIPPLEEQTEIGQYLDAKTQAIDKKINLLSRKSETYKELRKSIINDAVCKGLDKNVKLKESGIEWIAEIPKHWEVKRIKDIYYSLAGGTPSTKEKEYWIGEIPWIPSGKVQNNIVVPEVVEDFISEKALKESSTKIAKSNSILIALTGATCSNIGYLTFDTTINQSIVALLPKRKLDTKYYFYLLISGSEKIRTYMTGGAQGGINQEDVKFLKVLLPSLEEQTAIANYLDEKTQKIDAIVSNIGKQIDTLKELRKTLINDVVTGKIKVVNN